MTDEGWGIDDGFDDYEYDDDWGQEYDDEPPEPDWGYMSWEPWYGRKRRQIARFWAMWHRRDRKTARHGNDRFWRARNKDAFDQEAPF